MSRAGMKVARVEPVPYDYNGEFSGVYGPKIRRNLEVVVDKWYSLGPDCNGENFKSTGWIERREHRWNDLRHASWNWNREYIWLPWVGWSRLRVACSMWVSYLITLVWIHSKLRLCHQIRLWLLTVAGHFWLQFQQGLAGTLMLIVGCSV